MRKVYYHRHIIPGLRYCEMVAATTKQQAQCLADERFERLNADEATTHIRRFRSDAGEVGARGHCWVIERIIDVPTFRRWADAA